VHNLDIANWVMATDGDPREAHPVEANGMGGRVRRGNYGDIFDHHFIEFTYADGTKMFSQSRHQPGTWNQVSEFVHGTGAPRRFGRAGRNWKAATRTSRSTFICSRRSATASR